MNAATAEYRALCLRIAALSRQMKSRKRDDVAARPETQKQLDAAKAKRATVAEGLR